MERMSVLISGLGIAGPTLAYWLLRFGFVPTLVERAPTPRTHGYIVDFWGAGFDIAERMGILPQILAAGYQVKEVRIVDERGRRRGGFDADVFRRATAGRYTSLSRGDLSRILYGSVEGRVEALFDSSITALCADGRGVVARFEDGSSRRFDLVIGADGLHSTVRGLAFGPESRFEKYLGYTVAAFEVAGYEPRDADVYVAYSLPGRQVARFAMRDARTLFLFIVADEEGGSSLPPTPSAPAAYLHSHFSDGGWECAQILAALERADEVYFDRVSQIRMERWCSGRIALVGDAAAAPSLLAGQGSALAIIEAYVLAGELARAADVEEGLARYEQILQPFLLRKQQGAEAFAGSFAPRTRGGIWLRNQVTKLFALPGIAKLVMGPTLLDHIQLPDYRAFERQPAALRPSAEAAEGAHA